MARIHFLTTGRVVELADGEGANLLRASLRDDCGLPFSCATGTCGTDRVRVVEGAEHLGPVRRRERETLGPELLAAGYRLACQVRATTDVAVEWDPEQGPLREEASSVDWRRWRGGGWARDDGGARAAGAAGAARTTDGRGAGS